MALGRMVVARMELVRMPLDRMALVRMVVDRMELGRMVVDRMVQRVLALAEQPLWALAGQRTKQRPGRAQQRRALK